MSISKVIVDTVNKILGKEIGPSPDFEKPDAKIRSWFENVNLFINKTQDTDKVFRLYTVLTDLRTSISQLPLDSEGNEAYTQLANVIRSAEKRLDFFNSLDQVLDNPTFFASKSLNFDEEKKEFSVEKRPATLKEKNFFFKHWFEKLSTLPSDDISNKKLLSLAKIILDMHKHDSKVTLFPLYASRPLIFISASDSEAIFPLTAAQIARSPFLESLIEDSEEPIPFPYPLEKLQNYLKQIEQPISESTSEKELLDLMNTAAYLQDDELIDRSISMFEAKANFFSQEQCFNLIRSFQGGPMPLSTIRVEEALMRRLSKIIQNYSDKDILKVFQDLAEHLGEFREGVRILNLSVTKISSETLKELEKLFPNIEKLDISRSQVTTIPSCRWKKLEELNARYCTALTSIDELKNSSIKKIDINWSKVTTIPSGRWEKLEELNVSYCKGLTSIDGLQKTSIKKINISGTGVNEILSGRWEKLEELNASVCKGLTSIDGLQETSIQKINISGSGVTAIPVGKWKKLEELNASYCKGLTSIDELKNTGIKKIDISESPVNTIPDGKWEKLEELNAQYCKGLTSIDGLKDTGIIKINISGGGVKEILDGEWKKLKELDAFYCEELTSIDGLKDTGIIKIDISGSGVNEIPSGRWEKLEELYAKCCKDLTSIEGLKDTDIKKINISGSGVNEIPTGKWKKLEEFDASSCSGLTSLIGLENTGIKKIDISWSAVTTIPSGRWGNLEELNASSCSHLTSIDGLKDTVIQTIDITRTNIEFVREEGYWRSLKTLKY